MHTIYGMSIQLGRGDAFVGRDRQGVILARFILN